MVIKKIGFLISFAACLAANGQGKQDIISAIRKQFRMINSDTTLKKVTLSDEDLGQVTDGGEELTGFFKANSILKIYEWVGLSYGNRIREFYFKNEKLFFAFEKFDSFIPAAGGTELDHEKVKTSFEGRYYFDDGKLIEQTVHGKRNFGDTQKNIVEELEAAAGDDFNLLIKKKNAANK